MGRIVAIDYGKVRIGIAMTDPMGKIAMPFKTIAAKNNLKGSVENILSTLSPYLHEIDTIVLGYPILLSGREGEMAKLTKELKALLEKELTIPIVLYDERLTSALAERDLKEKKISRKKRKGIIDPIAATFLLQDYMQWAAL